MASSKIVLSREFYIEILKLCEKTLNSLIFIFDLQKNDKTDYLINDAYFESEMNIYKRKEQILGGCDIEIEDSEKYVDLALLFTKINLSEIPKEMAFQSQSMIKKADFKRLLKKTSILIELVSRIELYEGHRYYGIDIDSQILIRYLITGGIIEKTIDFVIICDIYAKDLMIYLTELYYRLGEGVSIEMYQQEEVWEMIERIIENSQETRKKEYYKVVSEKILRNNLQRNIENDDIPSNFYENYMKIDANGLILLYIKYKKIEVFFNFTTFFLIKYL